MCACSAINICRTINHDFLPTVGQELSAGGQHTYTYTYISQFELETTVTDSIKGPAKKSSRTI